MAIPDFKKNILSTLLDKERREIIYRNTALAIVERERRIKEIINFEELRLKAKRVKEEALSKLPELLEELKKNIEKRGGFFYFAKDGKDAKNYIYNLILMKNYKRVVKSKSMTAEEIRLREFLIEKGLDVIETDLGEYIVQLFGEPPSHIIAPAIHRKKEEVGEIFSQKFGIPFTSNPEELTKIAREKLRKHFLKADVGITGVNFALAETASIVIFENEGNARLTLTIPKIIISLMGMEKVIKRWKDLWVFLKILPPSATGQILTSYISIINDIKDINSSAEFHLVVLDNGRGKILENEDLKEVLQCIRCGACMNTCPVYRNIGGHAYKSVYQGPIGNILTPLLNEVDFKKCLPHLSTLCGMCNDVCPVKIDIKGKILNLRCREKKDFKQKIIFKILSIILRNSFTYRLFFTFLRFVSKISKKFYTFLLKIIGWGEKRTLLLPAEKSFRKRFKEL